MLVEESIAKAHKRKDFDCGSDPLNRFLKQSARQNDRDRLVRTFVLVDEEAPTEIIGFYSLCSGQIEYHALPEDDRGGLPRHPIPVARMARLAVDKRYQGKGYGEILIGRAVRRALAVRADMGVAALAVDAKDDQAAAFYQRYDFRACEDDPHALYLLLPEPPNIKLIR